MQTLHGDTEQEGPGEGQAVQVLGLVLVWSRDESRRVGEGVLLAPGTEGIVGRIDPDGQPLSFVQQRPGLQRATGALASARVSRRQLHVRAGRHGVQVENLGRAPMRVQGRDCSTALLRPGELLEVERRFTLMCVQRPAALPGFGTGGHRFGRPDAHGIVGESVAAWTLRQQLAFAAPRAAHVLVTGESGTGKELAARALHAASRRSEGPFVSRNAATFPESLVDAELFGNARNYPNAGMPARPGLIGEAAGGTLFLDEIGEMPQAQQAHLLRVLDRGEYHRLGDGQASVADLRLVAATNRDPGELKHDFLARMPLQVAMPGLPERRCDVPLLARHLLRQLAEEDPELGARFVSYGQPQLSQALMSQLLLWPYRTHVRELQALLWRSMLQSTGGVLEALLDVPEPEPSEDDGPVGPADIQRALEEADGVKTRAAELLGLRNRFQLLRLMKKFGLD